MSPRERAPLACGYAAIIVTLFGILGLFTIGATTLTVAVFVAGIVGVASATVGLVLAENATQRPVSRTG